MQNQRAVEMLRMNSSFPDADFPRTTFDLFMSSREVNKNLCVKNAANSSEI